ncbi:hypothetical protein HHK36_007817 [Tetracentron sinense]|uniref:non-specific serine/threonine protein kinase n=1 Tax=Tetracentron sinense TaxID=13715 RepID=A0A834ZEH2_TETSI|nr:hypothetical protein HHK36_007817 [Tetracentron sinense]
MSFGRQNCYLNYEPNMSLCMLIFWGAMNCHLLPMPLLNDSGSRWATLLWLIVIIDPSWLHHPIERTTVFVVDVIHMVLVMVVMKQGEVMDLALPSHPDPPSSPLSEDPVHGVLSDDCPITLCQGSHLDCGSSLQQPCISSSSIPVVIRKSKLGVVIIAAGCSAFLLLSAGAIFAYRYCQVNELKHEVFVDVAGEDECKILFGQLRRFSWRELQLATDNFSESNVIGQGGFGKVYRGILSDNTRVAVKRLTDYHNPGGEAAFISEVELISVAVHRNLLKLIGFCTTSSERVLVYPFMQNLSVAYRLRDLKPGEKGLDWPTRKRVAFGAAHGLEYLHEHCNPKIIHRDLKAANILLDDDFEAVLGDFGLAKIVDTKLTHVTTQVRGTMGHIAPEYLSTGRSSEKTDVFGYGITLLELVTGQRAIDFSRLEEEEDVLLLDHIKKLQREKRLDHIVDRNLKNYDPKEVEIIVQVALLCTQSSPEDRPKMAEVVSMMKGVGLVERWAEWEQLEVIRYNEYSVMSHQFAWAEDSTQEAIQLSNAR